MKKIDGMVCLHVISEPGDHTRYDYVLVRQDINHFSACPYNNTFAYPQQMSYWDAQEIIKLAEEKDFIQISKRYDGVNPYTILEVARTIVEIVEDKDGE